MRRKQQIQALQQELALLRQTVDSGKELAALAVDAAGQLRKPSLRTDRKSTRLNSSHRSLSRMPSSA